MSIYDVSKISDLLAGNTYPGRGIVVGNSKDGKYSVIAYFIMGRSENSRNRIFKIEEDGISTEAYDPSKLKDPSLIIYHPIRRLDNLWITTNGDQTDTIYKSLKEKGTFIDALNTREFEPDAPNFTPRISSILYEDASYMLSILKSADEKGSATIRNYFSYPAINGLGHFIHTYNHDGNPIPSFTGEPKRVLLDQDLDTFGNELWNCLDPNNKVSLYVAYIDKETKEYKEKIFNVNGANQ